jgi:hypothetical protein
MLVCETEDTLRTGERPGPSACRLGSLGWELWESGVACRAAELHRAATRFQQEDAEDSATRD